MKKFICSLMAIGLIVANAQNNDYKKRPTLLINFTTFDFKSAQAIRSTSLSTVLTEKRWSKVTDMGIGFGISYLKGLSDHVDLMASMNGAFVKYPFREKLPYTNDALLMEADAVANVKLLTDKHIVVPYLSAGVGVSKYATVWGAYIPVGAGIQVRLMEETYFITNFQYRLPVTQEANNHFVYSIGFGTSLSPLKKVAVEAKPLPVVPEVVPPAIEVIAPKDGDGDGITDDTDKCPTVAGLAKYFGCPATDTDKDGINDEDDKCPNQPGLARYQGCVIPDTDADGVNDEKDKCPTEAGLVTNDGCPVKEVVKIAPTVVEEIKAAVNTAAKNIFFETGKATLLKKSFSALAAVTKNLKENESIRLEIEGHTDNTGAAKTNLILSQKRANAVLNYLVKNGIEKTRLSAKGFGSTKPLATNKTAAGRAQNRRVVLQVIQ